MIGGNVMGMKRRDAKSLIVQLIDMEVTFCNVVCRLRLEYLENSAGKK